MKLEYARRIFEEHSNIKFHENPFSGNRVVCGQVDGRKDRMRTLVVAFLNFKNAPKNDVCHSKREVSFNRQGYGYFLCHFHSK